jgi:hypothetical protein
MNIKKIAGRLLYSLILIFFGGWILGGLLNTAAFLSPQFLTQIQCLPGSTIKKEWVQQSFDQPGQKTLTLQCVNQSGTPVHMRPDAEVRALEYTYFYPAGVILMAVILSTWTIVSYRRKMRWSETA